MCVFYDPLDETVQSALLNTTSLHIWEAGVRLSMCLGWIGQRSQVQWERPLMFSLTTGIKQRINSLQEPSACGPAGLCKSSPLPFSPTLYIRLPPV